MLNQDILAEMGYYRPHLCPPKEEETPMGIYTHYDMWELNAEEFFLKYCRTKQFAKSQTEKYYRLVEFGKKWDNPIELEKRED